MFGGAIQVDYINIWLDIKKHQIADNTYDGYKGIVERYIRPKWGKRQANQIGYIDIEHWISNELSSLASKTILITHKPQPSSGDDKASVVYVTRRRAIVQS